MNTPSGLLIGYARVSTADQSLNLQLDALKKAGCEKVFTDIESGAKIERKGLDDAIQYLRPGDTLVVWRLDRLGRSLKDLIIRITELHEQNIGFKCITENIDTTTSSGKLVFHIFGALAEFERDIIQDRTQAGLQAARVRGNKGGRPKVVTQKKAEMARKLYAEKSYTVAEICKMLNIKCTTIYRYLQERKETA